MPVRIRLTRILPTFLAIMSPPRSDPRLHVVLYAPRIPQNAGQIARTCHAMGLCLHLIRPLGFKTDSASLRRAGVGYWEDLSPTIHRAGEAFWSALPADARVHLLSKRGRKPYTEVAFARGDWLLLGNETEGLPADWLRSHDADTIVIPMANPAVRCLNLATVASVVIFEALRQLDCRAPPNP